MTDQMHQATAESGDGALTCSCRGIFLEQGERLPFDFVGAGRSCLGSELEWESRETKLIKFHV